MESSGTVTETVTETETGIDGMERDLMYYTVLYCNVIKTAKQDRPFKFFPVIGRADSPYIIV